MREILKLLLTLLEEDLKNHTHHRQVDENAELVRKKQQELDKLGYALWHDGDAELNKHLPKELVATAKKLKAELTQAQDRAVEALGIVKGYELGLKHAISRIERVLYEEKGSFGFWERPKRG